MSCTNSQTNKPCNSTSVPNNVVTATGAGANYNGTTGAVKISATCTSTVPSTSCPRVPPLLSSRPTFAPMPRSTSLLISPATIPSPRPALHSVSHRFFTPLFSASSESLFSQLLCFHIYLRCPLLFLFLPENLDTRTTRSIYSLLPKQGVFHGFT